MRLCALMVGLAALVGVAMGGCAGSERGGAEASAAMSPIEVSAFREEMLSLLTEASLSDDPLLRANAIEGLQAAPSRVEPVARRGLTDENFGVRFVSAMTVGELRLEESAAMVEPLLGDPSRQVRGAAMYALRRLGRDVDLTPLASMLADRDPRVSAQAAFILGELGNPSAVPLLRDAAEVSYPTAALSEVRILRLQIAEALVKCGYEAAIETVRASLFPSRPEDLEVAALAVQIIGEVGDRRSVDQLIYLTALRGEDRMPAEIRLAAASSLAKLGERAGSFIADEYADSAIPALRMQAAHVYGETGQPENLEKVRRLAEEDEAGIVRVAAASAALKILGRDTLARGGR
jgi:HEAT repeat protein